MKEPSHGVIIERIKNVRGDIGEIKDTLYEFKNETKESFKTLNGRVKRNTRYVEAGRFLIKIMLFIGGGIATVLGLYISYLSLFK